ncbi:FAD-binding oxidoreductase [bacterium]|nr:MAG: FAD-binding oxidoreductase [bacterium]
MGELSKRFLQDINRILPSDCVITERDILTKYSHDETPELKAIPDMAIVPDNSDQIESVVRLCYEYDVPITPRGAGTGVAGGAVPINGGVVISLERLNKIIDIDTRNLIATVQPGVITGILQHAVAEENLYYPPDPASVDSCSIGGNVATAAGGMRAFKYGTTKKSVQGLEVIFPPGKKVNLGGKMIKDVAGYDLIGILTGSEGTLGIFTQIMVRLVQLPTFSVDLLAGFDSIDKAIQTALSIVPDTGVYPCAMEFMEGDIIQMVETFLDKKIPLSSANSQLIVSIDGMDEKMVENSYFRVGEHLLNCGAHDVLVASNRFNSELLWKARRSIREAIRHRSPDIAAEDVAVPPTRTPELIRGVKKIGDEHNVEIVGFGHIGDGNIHIDMLRNRLSDSQWEQKKNKVIPEILRLAVQLEGTITGEHGIGCIKRKYFHLAKNNFVIERMRKIKQALDSKGLLNPGKVFP